MHDERHHTIQRARRYLRDRLAPRLYRDVQPARVSAWAAPGEPVPFAEAVAHSYSDIAPGDSWGRPWGTTWLRVEVHVPSDSVPQSEFAHGSGLELVVDLGFTDAVPGFQCEALAYDADGRVLAGVEPLNRTVPLRGIPGTREVIWLEAASNPDVAQQFRFSATPLGDPATAGDVHQYRLGSVFAGVREVELWHLMQDLTVLAELAEQLADGSPRRAAVLAALDRALDVIDTAAPAASAPAAWAELRAVMDAPAAHSAHTVHAVGHAHIDSAWLWPLRETRRKVARTFANVLQLMDEDDGLIFAASSAQQYAWLKEDHPELFERVRARVAEGRFVPVGGQWVEPDSNLPGGESMVRQLVEGTRFFMAEFGVRPREVWVPDSFGYSAALPQIARAAGAESFLTQKLSWNDTNRFPHHSFLWEGIDGTRIFTHFPPADTYNSRVSAEELLRAERQFAEAGEAALSLLPFGWGDGGGGPTREMVGAAHRFHNLEGAPRVELSNPSRFFAAAKRDYPEPPVWVGELYLEAHRGVSTTQIELKRGNRRSEALLREAELWSAVATVQVGAEYPAETIRELWREVLLLQFHDILPGSSIAWVHKEALERFTAVQARLETLIEAALRAVLGSGDAVAHVNSAPFAVGALAAMAVDASAPSPATQSRVSVRPGGGAVLAGAGHAGAGLVATFDARGEIVSLVDELAGRELVPHGRTLGAFRLFRDVPTKWDAWDLDARSAQQRIDDVASPVTVDVDVSGGAVIVRRGIGASTIVARYAFSTHSRALDVTIDLDWREDEKVLKWELPLALHTTDATSEIQFGHLRRAIHRNTSWDAARFETTAQRWVHVGEPDYGVALANAWTYGAGIFRDTRTDESAVTIGVTLARAPSFPDPTSDRGEHQFRFLLAPGADIAAAIELGYRLQFPVRELSGVSGTPVPSFITTASPAIVVETVKLADDGSGDVVVRLYESRGTRAQGRIATAFTAASIIETDLLENEVPPDVLVPDSDGFALRMRPFQLVTLRFSGVVVPV